MSQRGERRIYSNCVDVCEATSYRFVSVLIRGAGKTLRFIESAEVHTGQELRQVLLKIQSKSSRGRRQMLELAADLETLMLVKDKPLVKVDVS